MSLPPPDTEPCKAEDRTAIVNVDIEGTLDIICLVFNSLAAIPSIAAPTFLRVTNCPGIAPCTLGVVICITLEPAKEVVMGLLPKLSILRIFVSWLLEEES